MTPIRTPRGRLFRKYVVLFATLISTALLVSGLVDLYFAYQENKTALVALEREKAVAAASRIEGFVKEIERQIAWTAQFQLGTAGAGVGQRRFEYLWLLRQVPAITDLTYVDAAGKEQLRVSRLAMDVIGSQADFSNDPRFLAAKARRVYYGPVYFRKGSEPYMTLAMASGGQAPRVTVAEVNLKFIWDVVSQIRVGKQGHAYVVDGDGTLIAHPDISVVLQKRSLASLPQVRGALEPTAPAGTPHDEVAIARNLAEHPVLTAHAAITPLRWVVFVEQPLEEAFQPLYGSIKRTAVLMILGIALSIVVSLVLARRVVTPIRSLQEGAERLGAGELGHHIDVRTGDELEALALQFNRMAEQLQESYGSLERKVKEATQELWEKTQQLEIANRHKSAFLANMSHELRTPLNAIIGFSEVLLDPSLRVTDAERTQFLTDILHSGKHLLKLINEVLDLARVEAGRLELHLEPAHLREIIDAIHATMRPLAARKSIELSTRVDGDMLPFPMDAGRVRQVLLNLVGNAVKFTPEGGRVWVHAETQPGAACVEVGDTGPGIPVEDHERIFLEFQQVKTSTGAKPEGTGLGLGLARNFVEMHGGKLWLESEPGQGSRFYFTLPFTP